jgi:hypothetical protein
MTTTPPLEEKLPSRDIWQYIVLVLIIVSVLAALFFGMRAVRAYQHIHGSGFRPGSMDVSQISEWMSIPYIAHVYHVPEEYLFQQVNIPAQGNIHHSLKQLNRAYLPDKPGELLIQVQDALQAYWESHPTPPAPTPKQALP